MKYFKLKQIVCLIAILFLKIEFIFAQGSDSENENADLAINQEELLQETSASDVDALLDQLSENDKVQNSQKKNKESEIVLEKKGLQTMPLAELIVTNKITTKSEKIIIKVGESKYLGNLLIEIHKCLNDPNPYKPNNLILLTVYDNKVDEDKLKIFHGWMLSNNLSISTMEHPVYEVIPVRCLVDPSKTIIPTTIVK